jgi:hypothetical protein
MRFASCRRTAVLLSAFALVSLAGCFRSPNMTKLSCTTSAHCPSGYQCVVAAGKPAGICAKPVDAAAPDIVTPIDLVIGIDVTLPVEHAPVVDIAAPTIDSPATSDFPAALDTIGPLDTTPDLQTSPDLGADMAPDVPAQPDTALDSLPSCPVNLPQDCNGTCIAQNAACNGTCPAGQRTCPGGNTCIGIAAPACCSASECTTTAAHTIFTCTNNTCVTTCAPSYASCSSGCGDLTSDNSNCGTCGIPCTGGKICTSSTCQCPAGQGLCGGTTCVDITAAEHCSTNGITCNLCVGTATPWCVSGTCAQCRAGGSDCTGGRTCSNGTCSCPAGTTDCGSSGCINVNGSDGTHCGSCTNVCASNQTCSSGTCTCTLTAANACGGCLSWDFEWGSDPSPWVRELDPNWPGANGATNIQISQSQRHGGSSSLVAPILIDESTTFTAEVAASTSCLVNLAGNTMTAWVYISGPALTDWGNGIQVDTWAPSGQGDYLVLYWSNVPVGTWFQITAAFTDATPVNRIGIRLSPASNWQGTMYIDDVVITGL